MMDKERTELWYRKRYLRECKKDKTKVIIGNMVISREKYNKLMNEIGLI